MEQENEVIRRELVAAARAAGTSIRKEAIKRQAITAKVNLPLAKRINNRIEGLLRPLPKPVELVEKGPAEHLEKHLAYF